MRIRTVRFLSNSRLGFRGAILLVLGIGDVGYSLSLFFPPPETRASRAFAWREEILPSSAWGMLWAVIGIVLVVLAFSRQDEIGYFLAVGLKVVWAGIALGSFLLGEVGNGWAAAIAWIILACMIGIISGWPEPIRMEQVTVMDDEPQED